MHLATIAAEPGAAPLRAALLLQGRVSISRTISPHHPKQAHLLIAIITQDRARRNSTTPAQMPTQQALATQMLLPPPRRRAAPAPGENGAAPGASGANTRPLRR